MPTDKYRLISELLDGEVPENRLPGVLDSLCSQAELKNRWSRLVLMRECLHQGGCSSSGLELSERVTRALSGEPVVLAPQTGHRNAVAPPSGLRRYLRPAAGMAIAASVATVAIFALRGDETGFQNPATLAQGSRSTLAEPINRSGVAADVQFAEVQVSTPLVQPTSATTDQAWLSEYLLRHSEAAGFAGGTGFVPYVPIVTTDPGDAGWEQALRPAAVSAPRE